jgi:hypothetical protein
MPKTANSNVHVELTNDLQAYREPAGPDRPAAARVRPGDPGPEGGGGPALQVACTALHSNLTEKQLKTRARCIACKEKVDSVFRYWADVESGHQQTFLRTQRRLDTAERDIEREEVSAGTGIRDTGLTIKPSDLLFPGPSVVHPVYAPGADQPAAEGPPPPPRVGR